MFVYCGAIVIDSACWSASRMMAHNADACRYRYYRYLQDTYNKYIRHRRGCCARAQSRTLYEVRTYLVPYDQGVPRIASGGGGAACHI
eukprot:2661539-Pyramimonas_sp.AAC.1